MKLTCPRCGANNESDDSGATGAQASACVACGESLSGLSRDGATGTRAREYDGYAVGRRVLKIAPAWLLLIIAGFVLVMLFFSWASRPVGKAGAAPGDDFKNEATNRPPAPQRDAHTAGGDSKTPPATPASGAAGFETTPPAPAPPQDTKDATTQSTTDSTTQSATDETAQGARDSPTRGATSTTDVAEADAFSVQVGAFAELSQANEQVSRLRAAGFEARVVEAGTATRFHFQVRSGRFATREEAARLSAQLRAGGVAGQTVIIEPGK
jgi:cell division septation protein DedD